VSEVLAIEHLLAYKNVSEVLAIEHLLAYKTCQKFSQLNTC